MGKKIGIVDVATTLGYKFAITSGACITLTYLFSIEFFPNGLTPGEVVFFVFVSLAFGFFYGVLLLYGALSSIWLIHIISWGCYVIDKWKAGGAVSAPQDLIPIMLRAKEYLLASCISFSILLLLALSHISTMAPELLLSFFCAGFTALVLGTCGINATPSSGGTAIPQAISAWWRFFAILTLPLIIVMTVGVPMTLVHVVFKGLGIRVPDVSIEVPESELSEMERVKEVLGKPIVDCRRISGGRLLVHDADVLWTGVGSIALISFKVLEKMEVENSGSTKSLGEVLQNRLKNFWRQPKILREVTLRLDANSIHIIKSRTQLNTCFDLSSDMLFETGSEKLSATAKASLYTLADAIVASKVPEQVLVRGYSDARPLSRSQLGSVVDNQRLSELRADEVAKVLRSRLNMPAVAIVPEGVGRREPKVTCVDLPSMTLYERERCHAPNRRVEIQVHYSPYAKSTQAQDTVTRK